MAPKPTYEALQKRIRELEKKDATNRRQLEMLENVMFSTNTGLTLINPDMTIAWVNDKIKHMFPGDDPVGQVCHVFFEASDHPCTPCPTRECFDTGEIRRTKRYNPANGKWYQIISQPIGDETGALVQVMEGVTDITMHVESQEKASRQAAFTQTLLETLPNPVFYKDTGGRYLGCNRAFENYIGLPRSRIIGKTVFDIAPEEIARLYSEKEESLLLQPGHQTYEWIVKRGNGDIGEVIFNKATFTDHTEQVAGIIGVITDITERRRAENALQKSELRYRSIFHYSKDAVTITNESGKILGYNPAAARLFEIDEARIADVNAADFWLDPAEREAFLNDLCRREYIENAEVRMKTRSGREIIVSVSAVRMENGGEGTTILTNVHDITARREAENQRRELETRLENARKMQAVGTLSGGIAHEFNNILGIILGNAELTMDDVPKSNPAYAFLTEIRNASLRGKEIVRRLLGIGRKREHLKTFVNLCRLVEDEESFIRALQPKSIAVKTRLPKDCRPILGDADQLQKVLYHLCTNSLHAMEASGGVLEIGVKSRTLTAPLLCYDREILPGEYVRLRVTDDGIGIPPENLHRVFEPYYTTKEIDQGIGMGLAVVHGTVTRHGGGVRIRSTPGKGTLVECWFPAVQFETPVRTGENARFSRGNETILYIDDEASILRMAKMFLERLGYEVETQSDPANALVLFETNPDRFHLVITDRKMPAMTGVEFIARIKKIKPEVKTIMCTGYGDIDPLNDPPDIGADALLLKPIDRKAFAETIRTVLDQSLSNHPPRPGEG